MGQRVHVADVSRRVVPPSLPDDPLHGSVDPVGPGAAVVHRELDEEKVRLVPQHVVLEAEDAEVGAGAANGRIDLARIGLGILLTKPSESLRPPPGLRRDAAPQVPDLHVLPSLELGKEVRQAATGRVLDRVTQWIGLGRRRARSQNETDTACSNGYVLPTHRFSPSS